MEELIRSLNNAMSSGEDSEAVFEIITQIISHYSNLTDYSKIDQDLAISFPQPPQSDNYGLLQFLKSQITHKPHDKSKKDVLELLSWIVENVRIPNYITRQYVVRFKVISDLMWKNPKERSKSQIAALDVLINIFKMFGTQFQFYELEAVELYTNLLTNSERSCYQPTVRGKMFHLLGLLAHTYPTDLLNKPEKYTQLFNHLVSTLRAEVESVNRKMEAAILHGPVKGLDAFLFSFKTKLDPNSENMASLYRKLEQIVDPKCSIAHEAHDENEKVKRREFQRAGLELISNHAQHFDKYLSKYSKQWYEDLLLWAKSNNIDDSRVGLKAMFKFLEAISEFYLKEICVERAVDKDSNLVVMKNLQRSETVKFFTNKFRIILNDANNHGRELTIAVKGFGIISQICQEEDFSDDLLFKAVVKRVAGILGEMDAPIERKDKYSKYGSISLLPTYLEAVGQILFSMKISNEETVEIFTSRLLVLERLSVALVIHFPELSEKYRRAASYSFNRILTSLFSQRFKWCRQFVEKIVHEGMTHIIASPTKSEVDILNESYIKSGNEKDFKKLNLKSVQSYVPFWIDVMKLHNPDVESTSLLYDTIMQWSLETIEKFDLTIEFDSDDLNDAEEANAEVLIDPIYNTKANMARDFQLFINLVDFLETFIPKSGNRYFEKWIPVVLDETIKSLETFPFASGFYKIIAVAFDMVRKMQQLQGTNESDHSSLILRKCSEFVKSLSLRVDDFRDDLLLSVLNIWLSAPNEIIAQHFVHLEGTMKTVFRTGRTCFSLAANGITALERWFQMDQIQIEDAQNLFRALFPILKSYFTAIGEDNDTVKASSLTMPSKGSKNNLKKSKSQLEERRFLQLQAEKETITLRNLQLSILKLVGSYGHFMNLDSCNDTEVIMTIDDRVLKYSIPFQDIKPDIYFEKLLPRVLELCSLASDRQLRTSGCECLHSIVLYFLGHSVNSTTFYGELFLKLFKVIISLGCDNDIVVRQLFNPLTIQVVHWFSRKDAQNYGNIVLQVITDNLAQTEDALLRDFSGVCMSEFFTWCIKHSNNEKIIQVMKALCAMGTHAAPKYRQGSVLAFNSIYREFRENTQLVSAYTFELVYSYIISLGLPCNLCSESVLVKSTQQAIRHLERIIIKKQDKLNTAVNERRYPQELGGPTLSHLVSWILIQSGRSSTPVGREVCLSLLHTLACHIRGVATVENFLLTFTQTKTQTNLIKICEHFLSLVPECTENSIILSQQMEMALNASAEIYLSLSKGGLSVASLLKHPDSKFIQYCSQFFENDMSLLKQSSTILGTLSKVGQVLLEHSFSEDCLLKCFIKKSLHLSRVISGRKGKVGDVVIVLDNLWSRISTHVTRTDTNFVSEIKKLLTLDIDSVRDCHVSLAQISQFQVTVKWLNEVLRGNHLLSLLTVEEKSSLANQIWNYIQSSLFAQNSGMDGDMCWISNPIGFRHQELLQSLLILKFGLAVEEENLVFTIFDPTPVVCHYTKSKSILTKGEIFQQMLLPVFCFNEKLVNFKYLQTCTNLVNVGRLIEAILTYVKNNKGLRKRFGRKLFESTLEVWQQLHLNCDPSLVSQIISCLASIDMESCQNSMQICDWWCSPLLMTSPNLTLKEKSEFIRFFSLLGCSSDSEIVKKSVSAVDILVKQSLNESSHFIWSQEEYHIAKVFFKLLNVYESRPDNLKLLEVLVRYVSKCANLSDKPTEAVSGNELENKKLDSKIAGNNVCSTEIRNRLKTITTNLSKDELKVNIADCIFKTIIDPDSSDCRQNLAANKFCLIPIIGSLPDGAFKKFYRQNILAIIQQIEAEEPPAPNVSFWNLKTVGMSLVEILALQANKEFLIGSDLNRNVCEKLSLASGANKPPSIDEKFLFRRLVKAAQDFRKPAVPTQKSDSVRAANFNFNSASFNAIVALLKAGQSGLKPFTGFVFREGGETDWLKIVRTTQRYVFPLVMDAENDNIILDERTPQRNITNTYPNQNIYQHNHRIVVAESSLANDASRFDFTTSINLATSPFYKKVFAGINPYGNEGNNSDRTAMNPEASLEWSAVNEHECMFSLVQAMKHMKTFQVEDDFPEWTMNLKSLLEKSSHPNVKAFIIGAIMNCEDVFKPYAAHFIEVILQAVLSDTFRPKEEPDPDLPTRCLNHFVKDIVIMVLGWSDVARPKQSQVKSLLEFMIIRADNQRNDVCENNLEVLQAILRHWVVNKMDSSSEALYDESIIPFHLIAQGLQTSDLKFGLSMAKTFCLAEVLPCQINNVANFVDLLSRAFSSSRKVINTLTGEVTGLLLRVLHSKKFGYLSEAMQRIKKKLDRERGRVQSFLIILANIQKYFPTFLVPFKNDLMSFLKKPVVRDQTLNILIEILKEELRNESIESKKNELVKNLCADLEGRGVFSVELKNQLVSGLELLEICLAVRLGKSEDKIRQFVGWVQQAEFGDDLVRASYAKLLSNIYTQFGGHKDEINANSISRRCEKTLIRLLFDENLAVQNVVQEFWSNNLKSWATSPKLLLELIEVLGDNSKAIPALLDLMMKRCSSSPDFGKEIFDKSLGECIFQHYDINTSWRMQSSLHPLFSESLSSSQNLNLFPKGVQDSLMSQRHGTQVGMNLLRSTLKNLEFSQTQERPSQKSYSQSQEMPMDLDDPFSFGQEESFVLPSQSEEDSSRTNNPLASLRRRFYERSEAPYYANRQLQRQQTLIDSEVEVIRSRRGGVKLSRTYRIGELPDIAMKNSDLLSSVIALVRKDDEIGKAFVILLASGFVREMDDIKKHEFAHNANIAFEHVFTNHGIDLHAKFGETLLEMSVVNELPVKSNLISGTSRRFCLERIGILKLEKDLEDNKNKVKGAAPPKRPRLQLETPDYELWLRIGELYKQLEDFDSVRNVFTHLRDLCQDKDNKRSYFEKAREALHFESISKYTEAKERYEQLYQLENELDETDPLLLQFFDDAIYKVLTSLSEWETRYVRCHEFCINHPDELQSDNYHNRLLPNQLSSGVQSILRLLTSPESDEEDDIVMQFKIFIQNLRENDEEWKLAMERCPVDLSILHFLEEDENKSQVLLESSWLTGLHTFQSFDKLSKLEKKNCFLNLQKSSALEDTLNWMTKLKYSAGEIENITYSLVEKWRKSTTTTTIPILNADLVVAEKSAFLHKISNKIDQHRFNGKRELLDEILRLQFEQHLWVVQLATLEGNADVGNYYLERARIAGEGCDEEELLKWRKSLCQLLTSCESSYTMKDWTKQWCSSWKRLAKLGAEVGRSSLLEVQSDLLASLLGKMTKEFNSIPKKCLSSLSEVLQVGGSQNYNELMEAALNQSINLIGKATGDDEMSDETDIIVSSSGEVAMKFFHLTESIMQKFPGKYQKSETLHEKLLVCMFHGMQNGHKIAIRLFPSSFRIFEKFPNLIDRFRPEIDLIQSWIFLPWLDQIITNYNHKLTLKPLLKPIIERLLAAYPHAFQLQYSDLDLIQCSTSVPTILRDYKTALKAIVLPHILFKKMPSLLRSNSSRSQTMAELMKVIEHFKFIKESPEFYGKIHQDYVEELLPKVQEKYKKLASTDEHDHVEKECEKHGNEKLSKTTTEDIISIFDPKKSVTIKRYNIAPASQRKTTFLKLENISPWLANYHFSMSADGIEIPGLYTKFREPDAIFHPKIVSFESTVKVFDSNTSPIRLTLIANNGKKYPFLLKHGDDLRQDKRIQQLFSLFNQVLENDSRCRERDLSIQTYSVIPISDEFGLIELVSKTTSIMNFTLNSAEKLDKHANCSRKYSGTIALASGAGNNCSVLNIVNMYGVYAGVPRQQVEKCFDVAVSSLPRSLFRDNVQLSSETLHSYFLLREKLIRSYSTMCIVHYLLGIGDRHLENNMLKLDSGQFLGIDFGHAFGSATVDLPVPELIPFRLTPQLQNFMEPYGCSGIFKEVMMQTWRAILKSSELISSVVEIFATEPSVKWSRKMKSPDYDPSVSRDSSNTGEIAAIQLLRDKLARRNPLEIVDKLLQMNEGIKSFKDNWKKVLFDGREEQSSQFLDDEQLIDILISLASDKNVIGRMYTGWGAWV